LGTLSIGIDIFLLISPTTNNKTMLCILLTGAQQTLGQQNHLVSQPAHKVSQPTGEFCKRVHYRIYFCKILIKIGHLKPSVHWTKREKEALTGTLMYSVITI